MQAYLGLTFVIVAVGAIVYGLAIIGEPQSLWFMRLIGVM